MIRSVFKLIPKRYLTSSSTSSQVIDETILNATKSCSIKPDTSSTENNDIKLKQMHDSYLLALADMENLRQRTRKEIESASLFAIQKFSKDIFSISDVLEMALNNAQDKNIDHNCEKRLSDLIQGLKMTLDEISKIFARHGINIINPLGHRFDPNLHNALYEVESTDLEPGTITSVQKKGFLLHGRVIRAADVGISKGKI